MRTSIIALFTAALASLGILPGITAAVELDANNWVVVPNGTPFAGETPIASVTSSDFDINLVNFAIPPSQWTGNTPPTYRAASGNLTTTVYRAADGSLGFAYAIHSQHFSQPFFGPPFTATAIPHLFVSGFNGLSTDVSGDNPPSMTAIRSADGGTINFNFSSGNIPQQDIPFFYSFYTGQATTLFVQTNATTFKSADATLAVQTFDGRDFAGLPATDFSMQSFVPALGGGPGNSVPEPVTLALLPLALAGWHLHRRRA